MSVEEKKEARSTAIEPFRQIGRSIIASRYNYDGEAYRDLNDVQHSMKLQIDQKISDGVYQFEKIDCIICGSQDMDVIAGKDRNGLYCPLVVCQSCGLIQANPRMTEASYAAYYDSEYRPLDTALSDFARDVFDNQYPRGKRVLAFLKQHGVTERMPKDAFVVEVGCGAGGILKAFQEEGYRVAGVDLGSTAIAYGRDTYGLDLRLGTLGEAEFDEAPDLIIYSHVLEHILDPRAELQKIRGILKPGGFVYIEVPGVRHLRRSSYDFLDTLQNAHVTYFTLKTLRNLLEAEGYKLVAGTEFIFSVFQNANAERPSAPANDYSTVVRFLRNVELERRIFPIPPLKILRRTKAFLASLFSK